MSIWTGSVRLRLILGVCAIVALVMTAFVIRVVEHERAFLEERTEAERVRLAETLAANSVAAVLINDLVAVEEAIAQVRSLPGLRYAMVFAADGRVLAHSELNRVGTFISDHASLSLLDSPGKARVIIRSPALAEAVAPVMTRGMVVGWARLGLDHEPVAASMAWRVYDGILHVAAAVLLSGLLAGALASGLTSRLNRLIRQTSASGVPIEAPPAGVDEVGAAAHAFNAVSAALRKADGELQITSVSLVETQRKCRDILNNIPDAFVLYDVTRDGRFRLVDMNPAAEKYYGTCKEAAWGKLFDEAVQPERVEYLLPLMRECIDTGQSVRRKEHLKLDSGFLDLDTVFLPVPDDKGCVNRLAVLSRDITEHLRVSSLLHRLSAAVQQSPVPMIITDASGTIEYVNPAFCTNSQYAASEVLGQKPRIVRGGGTAAEEYAQLWRTIRSGETWRGMFHNKRKDGSLHWEEAIITPLRDGEGNITQFVAFQQDISARKAAEERVDFLAHHDTLTGLPNRLLGKDRVEQAIAQAGRSQCKAALLFLDVDGFKKVNDAFGHGKGDALLKAVAERLKEAVRKTDSVARQSGDEFLIVLSNIRDNAAVTAVTASIMDSMARPFTIDGQTLTISVSAGIAVYPDDGKDIDSLFKKADIAMYAAKEAGKNTYRFFTREMNAHADEYLRLRGCLQNALVQKEFVLHYQPQIDLKSGQVAGVEALLRWNSPDLGIVPPDRFLPVAEDSGLIVPIGDWVLGEACRQAAAWQKAGLPKIVMAVNLSAVQLRNGDVAGSVQRALSAAKLDPSCLELEVAESVLIKDATQVLSAVRGLKALGVSLSVDDFGTGYSSLSYLKRYGANKVKIDPSFIRDLTSDTNSAAVVNAIVQMARSLGLTTIAEGVEDVDVLDALQCRECDGVQGYFYARPMAAAEVRTFLATPRQPRA